MVGIPLNISIYRGRTEYKQTDSGLVGLVVL